MGTTLKMSPATANGLGCFCAKATMLTTIATGGVNRESVAPSDASGLPQPG
jgi:hypothetical protein